MSSHVSVELFPVVPGCVFIRIPNVGWVLAHVGCPIGSAHSNLSANMHEVLDAVTIILEEVS